VTWPVLAVGPGNGTAVTGTGELFSDLPPSETALVWLTAADRHARDSRMAVIVEPRSAPSLNIIRLPCRSLVALGVKVHPDGDEVCADEVDKTRVALCSAAAQAYLCESVVGVVLGP
jgi:hypothetical protein